MAGTKHDQDKLRMDLIPPEAMEGAAEVLTFGAKKYGDRNWEKGLSADRIRGAVLRHLTAWTKGETLDPETGLSHLKHALCGMMFMVTMEERGMWEGTNDQ